MKRILLSFAVITALLASCNMNVADVEEPRVKADSTAIGFGVYVNRGVSTKAGKTGELTTATLQEADGGFGVFGYYGNGALYNESSKPDFMYNEVVTYAAGSGKWEYHPVKYWPNEFGTAASSEAVDRLSFFAYAPYAEVIPSTGIVTATGEAANTGIIGLSRNIAAGDPMVMYSASLTPGAGVDLCWGVAAADFTSSVDGDNNHVDKGSPFINVIKPKTGDRLQFEFNHALAQLNVQVDADIDVESHATSSLAAGTHIYVRSVTFTGFTLRGSLNLNANTTNGPAWFDLSGSGRLKRDPITIFDGRTDGLEAIAADVNEVPSGLYPAIVQDGTTVGVTNTPVNLFNSTEKEAPILVIPTSGVPVKVTIVYDVETADPSLPGYLSDGVTRGISVENTITKTVQLSGANMALEAGKKYVLGLHLGLTSVKFDATVADWDNTSYTNTDLPINTTGIESVTLSATEATVWRSSSVTKPTVTAVTATDGTDLTNLATITWSSSNPSVATVDETTGEITTVGHGNTNIKATATYNRASGSAVFALHVNEVTAVSVEPATSSIINTNSVDLTATLTINGGSPVNGTVTAWPTVTWSSSYDKISVDPASTDATYSGTAIVATTTATAAANAVATTEATITAAVGTPFAASEVSGTSTLTCEDKTAIASVNLGATETTVWLSEGASTPTVTVMGTDGNPLTTGVTLAWASNNESVATVTNAGVVTLHGTGTAKLTVTATLAASATTEASSKTADYMVYVNNVTGVTIAPATSNIVKDGTLDLT
ncbi:MAG: Ig-like domain-containing protein, partial [Bacteroidales bacterium]|nr:Ig-like domain-containing protein [Bacteroidales bacterium]